MRLRISNLAWNEASEFLGTVKSSGVTGVELAPTKIWPTLEDVTAEEVKELLLRPEWQNLKPMALQALLYGRPDLQLFQEPEMCFNRLETVMQIAKWLEVRILVFGAPKNRLITPESAPHVFSILERVGKMAERYDCLFCVEPNPPLYGGNWALDLSDTLGILRTLDHPAVRLHADTGAMLANGESAVQLESAFDQLASCHISLPGLRPLTRSTQEERHLLRETMQMLFQAPDLHSVGLEMGAVETLEALTENIAFFNSLAL
jgi:D-psicose/D-tagatose/L-ribulose 3-epimerase